MKKTINIITSAIFVLMILGFAAAFLIVPDSDFSEEENRSLTTFPTFSVERLVNGTFSEKINEYFADQFPFRDSLVGIKSVSEMIFGKGENNGVLLGDNGQIGVRLFTAYKSRLERTPDTDYYYTETVDAAISAINSLAESTSLPIATILPPRTIDAAASAFSYPTEISDSLDTQLENGISNKANYINLLPIMREKYDAGEYVYNRTDHHWTTYGAYIAYTELLTSWGMEDDIIPRESFTVETISDFYGTTWSKAGYKFVAPDTLELWSLGNESDFTTTCYAAKQVKGEDGKPTTVKEEYHSFEGWLNREYLSKKDKYAAFLDGTHNEQTVTKKTDEPRERLLVVKDSFANTMVPFLAQHFDLVIVNLANNMSNVTEYAKEYDCDRIVIIYNRGNVIENANLASIK